MGLGVQHGARSGSAGARRVLVIDDPDSADIMQSILELSGHVAVAVYDGESALEMAETFRPEVVLLDVGLPDLDGYELANRLRELPNARHARVAAVTGWARADDRARSHAHGFDAHMVKPVDLSMVLDLIAAVPAQGREPERV